MRQGCFSCVIIMMSLLSMVAFLTKSTAAPGTATLPPSEPGLDLGDEIRVYLANSSQHPISVTGKLEYADINLLRLRGKNSESVGYPDGVHIDTREVLRWVPRTNVLYIEKILSEHSEPAPKPTGTP